MMARQIIREFLSVFLALLMAFQPVSTFALASCSQGSTLDEWTGLTKSLKQPEETGGNQDALDPMGSAPKIDEAKAVVPKPAASVVTPMDWQSISNILFQVQQAGASPGADLNRAYQTLVAKFGAREIYFVQELLTHYEHWNNAKFKQAKSITEIPGALAGVDASFVKVFGLSESESKKSLREVLIESFLKNPKRVARLARADGQLGSFFDASLPSLFDDQELKSVYERLNEFPEKDHLFPGWQELENLNRNIVLSLSQLKTKEELRKFLKAELKVENLIAVPFSKMNEVLETFVKAKQQQMLAAMPGNGAENGAKDESKELAALVNSADFQSDLFFGGRVSDQVAEMQATHDRKTPNFDAYEYRRKLNTDEWLKKADHVDYAGREKYRLIDAEKLGANLEIPSDLLVASSVSLPLSYQYGLTPDQMRAKFKNEQAAERFLESITSYTKYETREQKLKHLLAAKIISPKSDGDLRNDSAFLLTYSLNDLSALHFIRQTILNFPLEENQKNLDSKRLETAANRILKLQTRLEKVIGGLPELKFTSLAEFDRFEAKVFKVLDGISAAAPGIRVARYGFAGKKLEGRDELPTGAPKPLSISDFINMRGGEEVAFSSSRQTVFHNPEELLVQLEASQTTIAKKREKLAAELLKSWKEHFEKTVLSNVTERIPKQISELKKKLAETKEKPAQEALKTEITQLEQSIGDVEGFKKFAAQFSFSDWTLPQLEALQFLATRYGWEDIWFTKSPDPSGKKQWISTPIPIFSFVANFNPKDPIETANLLAGVQHVAAAEGIYLTIFGADWKKTLKLTKDGSRPSPLEVELQLPIVEKIIQELVKYQGFASQFSSGLSTQGGFPIPAVQWTDKKRQELVRFLDNPDSVVVDPKDPKTQQAFAERIRVPIQEAHLQTLFNQAAEIVWQKSDLEIRGEKVVAADRLKPLVHAQLLELGTILAPEIERRDQELRAMNRSLMQKWPSDAEQLSQKIAVAVTKDGMDYENFLKLLSGLIKGAGGPPFIAGRLRQYFKKACFALAHLAA
jgi:DNA-binding transcriptional MerR regulator